METIQFGEKNNKGHYSAGVISNGMLYISGQLSIHPESRKTADGGIREHMRLALENMGRVLSAAGLKKDDVVKCSIYITDVEYWDAVNEEFAHYFGEHRPARIVIPVPELHFGCLTEIEAVAEVER